MNRRYKRKGSTVASVTCAIIFCLFAFLYIYCYQTPTLSFAQHVLSGGVTFYHPLVSAIVITVIAQIIQVVFARFINLGGSSYALTYFPAMLFIALLTCGQPDAQGKLTVAHWVYGLPVVIIIYVLLVGMAKQWIEQLDSGNLISSRMLSLNLLTLLVMMLLVVNVSNGDPMFHRQVWAEKLLIDRRYSELAKEGRGNSQIQRQTGVQFLKKNSNLIVYETTDSTLTLLRFIAMSKLGILADSLFTQPVVGGTGSLMRMENVHPYLFDKKFLSRTKTFDYKLCALLAEGDLDNFARKLQNRYDTSDTLACDTLPRHYREALVLYQHLRQNPVTAYKDPVLETDYEDMRKLQEGCLDDKERNLKFWQTYRNTYWYYYITKKASHK